jgi:hypothetical protein
LNKYYNSLLAQIKRAEAEIFLWQALFDKITGNIEEEEEENERFL